MIHIKTLLIGLLVLGPVCYLFWLSENYPTEFFFTLVIIFVIAMGYLIGTVIIDAFEERK